MDIERTQWSVGVKDHIFVEEELPPMKKSDLNVSVNPPCEKRSINHLNPR
jgi:hypothetical protein